MKVSKQIIASSAGKSIGADQFYLWSDGEGRNREELAQDQTAGLLQPAGKIHNQA
jgi:hypothetical protein